MSLPASPFDDVPVVGRLADPDAEARLRPLGEAAPKSAAVSFGTLDWLPWRQKLWAGTAHAFGYLPPAAPGGGPTPVRPAGNIAPDLSLKGARVRISLDRLRVAQYPGGGTHRVLFDFAARHQGAAGPEDLHFNAAYRVREGEAAGVMGYPIFVGLTPGPDGLAFRCYTVNVKNDGDEALLGFLEGDTFRAGLRLVTTAQPALAPLSALAVGVTKAVAGRSRNVPVQDFALGLDFGANPTGARLAEGSYLAVQVPDAGGFDWAQWVYDPAVGQVVGPDKQPLPYNYVVFGVSRYTEA